ncbi:GTP pyrophosphokinase [Bacillus oleivorans]|uniref:GTP pyrophosphokinase n=1 Tax=Bacillus oleivorans TaxID=1448271 RepID=A0A285D4C7_9BACI|nr:HD domain-containing protein [Bacillus oleivorans]SNX74535.1 GTP pyrophosphokinase [Bacillus oleivorans]
MELLKNVHYLEVHERNILINTIEFASRAHKGQVRDTGEPFIMHPLTVAQMLADYQADLVTLQAAVLHDVVEDTAVSIEEIDAEFGKKVSYIVNALTKGKKPLHLDRYEFMQSYYTQLLLASSHDVRVAVIKIFDRLHNIQTLHGKPVSKQVTYANETLTFFAPLLKKLGLRSLLHTLEERALFYLNQDRLKKANEFISQYKKQLEPIQDRLAYHLNRAQLKVSIQLDQTPVYSLLSSLQSDGVLEREVYIRIHTHSEKECYRALKEIHSIWKPVNAEFTNFMHQQAAPFDPYIETFIETNDNQRSTVKIMTKKNAHRYDHGILSILNRPINPFHFYRSIEYRLEDLNAEMIIHECFLPMIHVYNQYGEVVVIPEGATVVDYLFHVYGDRAFFTTNIKINGKVAKVNKCLHAGDRIYCTIGTKPITAPDWIHFATTSKALMHLEKQKF